MNAQNFLTIIIALWPWGYVKIALLAILFLYIIVAAIALRQIDLMSQMVEAQISPVLRLVALAHLIAAIIIFVMAFLIL